MNKKPSWAEPSDDDSSDNRKCWECGAYYGHYGMVFHEPDCPQHPDNKEKRNVFINLDS